MGREIFKRDGFWQRRSHKLEISLFMIAITISIFLVAEYSDSPSKLTKVATASVIETEEQDIINLEIGQQIKIGDAVFIINKLDKEKTIRNYVTAGTFYIFSLTVKSDKPYIPEPRIVSGRNEIAPNYEIEETFGNVLRQVEGNATGIKIFDVPRGLRSFYLNLDISNKNSTLIKL